MSLLLLSTLFLFECFYGAEPHSQENPYQQAASLIQRQELQPAIALLRKTLEQAPQDLRALNLLGIALTMSGQIDEANTHFHRAIALNPRFHAALKNLAINEMALNRSEEARAHFTQYLQFDPNDAVAHLALGEIYFRGNQFADAVKHFDQSRDLPFKDSRVILSYAKSCIESKQIDRAAAILGKLGLEADAATHFEAGLMYVRIERFDGAARQFEMARSGHADPQVVVFNLALAYIKNRNYATAIGTLREFLSQGNQRAEFYNLLSQAYEGDGQTIEAYNALRTATQLDPKDENNYLDLAILCVDHANYDLGLEIINIGIKNVPQSDRLFFQRGTLLAMKGESKQAVVDFEAANKLAPTKGLPYVARAVVLLELGQSSTAIELLHQRVAANSNEYIVQYVLGEALNRSGPTPGSAEEKEAVQALEKSVSINPIFSASRAALGKMLLRRGDLDRAIAELEKALELDPAETSSIYQLALAHRKKGNMSRAKELFAKVDQAKSESKEQFMNRTLLRLVREGSK